MLNFLSFEARLEFQGWTRPAWSGLDFVTAGPEYSGGCVSGMCFFECKVFLFSLR